MKRYWYKTILTYSLFLIVGFLNFNGLAKDKILSSETLTSIDTSTEPQEEIGSLTFTVVNHIPNPASLLRVEICRFGLFDMQMMGCITMSEIETIKHMHARTYHITRIELDTLLKRSDLTEGSKLQFRFKDVGHNQTVYKECDDHPYTVLDPNGHEKRFLVEVWQLNHVSYSCRVYKEEGGKKMLEPKGEGLIDRAIRRLNGYKTWVQNRTGLTFSVKNNLKGKEPRLKVQVCSYVSTSAPTTCVAMEEDDYIDYNKTRVYHLDLRYLDKLLANAEDRKIQFRFKDTGSTLPHYKPCWNELTTEISPVENNKGHRYEIDVNNFDHVTFYTCRIRTKS